MSPEPLKADDVRTALLEKNFLPKTSKWGDELPPCFTSEGFERASGSFDAEQRKTFSTAQLNMSRFDQVSRKLEVPHPVAYSRLVSTLHHYWDDISGITVNPQSRLRPQEHPDGRVSAMMTSEKRLVPPVGSRYLVRADITNFYGSIYTHAIPWALVGVPEAKRNRRGGQAHNDIDTAFRNAKRGETVGAAVGPGTSLIAGEILLASVDKDLAKTFVYERYLDDYVCYTESQDVAEEFLRQLSAGLGALQLQLNPRKTGVEALPVPKSPAWVRRLMSVMDAKISTLIDTAIDVLKEAPNASSLRFVLHAIEALAVDEEPDSDDIASLLLLANLYPTVVPSVCLILDHIDDIEPYRDALLQVLHRRVLERHSDGVCWILYLLWSKDMDIEESGKRAIFEMADAFPLALLLAKDAETDVLGTVAHWIVTETLDDWLEVQDLRDELWPVLYELYTRYPVVRLRELPGFTAMAAAGIEFIVSPDALSVDETNTRASRAGMELGEDLYQP